MNKKHQVAVLFVSGILLVAQSSNSIAGAYRITKVAEITDILPVAFNNRGLIGGSSDLTPGAFQQVAAILDETPQKFSIPGELSSQVTGLNDRGDAVGVSFTKVANSGNMSTSGNGFLIQNGFRSELPNSSFNDVLSPTFNLNNRGDVVASYWNGVRGVGGELVPKSLYLYRNGNRTDLTPTLKNSTPKVDFPAAVEINDAGVILINGGISAPLLGFGNQLLTRAYVYDSITGNVINISNPDRKISFGIDLTQDGEVLATSFGDEEDKRNYVWSKGVSTFIDQPILDALGFSNDAGITVRGLNDDGLVVGSILLSTATEFRTAGFVFDWHTGKAQNLYDFFPSGGFSPAAINDRGQIFGRLDGCQPINDCVGYYLLTPDTANVPVAPTILLTGLGLLLLFSSRRIAIG
jgi:uncharacterized membrane protein